MTTVKSLPVADYARLMLALEEHNTTSPDFFKYYLIALFMGEAGLRVGEAVALIWDDVWLCGSPSSVVRIRKEVAKNRLERSVPMHLDLQKAIKYYRSIVAPGRLNHDDYLFIGLRHRSRHLSVRSVQYYLEHISIKALGRRVHPHSLRHTFGTKMMKRTNLRVVQELMGHKSITSTQVYTHPDHDDLRNAVNGLDKQ